MLVKEKKIGYVFEFYVFLILIRISDTTLSVFFNKALFVHAFFVTQNIRCLFCLETELF